jgi:DNA-binding beta-propeller fold protein YncE
VGFRRNSLGKGLLISCALFWSACSSDEPLPRARSSTISQTSSEPKGDRSFTTFESGQVRPLALSLDGRYLYALNTPDNRLEIYGVLPSRALQHITSVPVGLEPVAVAERSPTEVWVVNHLSDSISVIDVSKPMHARVARTLLVGDEPRDIVFAGPSRSRAFITTAHRGQNTGRDPQFTKPGVPRADVWIFDADKLGDTLEGIPLAVISLFTDTPRALATTPDGSKVYAAGFLTGNRTTTVNERIVTNLFLNPAPPLVSFEQLDTPQVGQIVKFDGSHWADRSGRIYDAVVPFSLPDKDVFAIDATANPPQAVTGPEGVFAGVGTVLFNMAVNPRNGHVYVANLEALNDVRFEGHNVAGDGSSVRGHIAESRITVLDGTSVTSRHLNKHIDYSAEGTPEEREKSLAFPMDMAVSSDGRTLYVAAFGSSKVGVYSTAALEGDTFQPGLDGQILVSGGGPSGLALDERRGLLFVLTRFDNSISVVDTASRTELAHVAMYNPEPAQVQRGRRFLYDAALTSAHGDTACASCHIFGDFDGLAWDLGDPDGSPLKNPGPFTFPTELVPFANPDFHPLKGPMTTQSLRGMDNHGPMHWRGDRTGGNDAPSAQPNSGTFDEDAAFKKFNPAFVGLLGRNEMLSDADMQAFADFILEVTYPPNPVRNLDDSLNPDQAAGRDFFFSTLPDGRELPSDGVRNCNGCHVLDPDGNREYGVARPGFFGTDGKYSFDAGTQFLKVPHMRNLYQKVGMFGVAPTFGLLPDGVVPRASFLPSPLNEEGHMGEQVRGFGFLHDGSVDTLFRFFSATPFVQDPATNPGGIPADGSGMVIRRQLEAFALAFDSNLKPIVGQQVTLTATNLGAVADRLLLLERRAQAGDCELVVRAREAGREIGYLYEPSLGRYRPNRTDNPSLTAAALRARAARGPLTFTAVPPGSGIRMALDRNLDGVLDGD